jgi:hypothetical protein
VIFKMISNHSTNAIKSVKHFLVGKSQQLVTFLRKPSRPPLIIMVAEIMRGTVQLNHQPMFLAQKIRNEGTNRNLPGKFMAVQSPS